MDPLFVKEIQKMHYEWEEEDFFTYMDIVKKYGISEDIVNNITENYEPDPSWKMSMSKERQIWIEFNNQHSKEFSTLTAEEIREKLIYQTKQA